MNWYIFVLNLYLDFTYMIFTNIYICTILLFLKMSQIASCRCQPWCRCVTDRLERMDLIQRRNEGRGRLKRFTTSKTNAKIFKISLCYSRSLRKLFLVVLKHFTWFLANIAKVNTLNSVSAMSRFLAQSILFSSKIFQDSKFSSKQIKGFGFIKATFPSSF